MVLIIQREEIVIKTCEFCHQKSDTCLWVEFLIPDEEDDVYDDTTMLMVKTKKMVCDDCLMAMELGEEIKHEF